jgi:thiol-disulfide isomerase/thioredoxin
MAPEARGKHFGNGSDRRRDGTSSDAPRGTCRRAGGVLASHRSAAFVMPTLAAIAAALVATVVMASEGLGPSLRPWSGGAPGNLALDRLTGGRVDLGEFRNHVVLLHFFATWCEPCRTEMSALEKLTERHATRPLAIVAVSVAEVKPRVERFFQANPVSFPVLLDLDRAAARAWGVDSLPTTIVLDPQLKPVLIGEGDLDWDRPDIDAALEALLPKTDP